MSAVAAVMPARKLPTVAEQVLAQCVLALCLAFVEARVVLELRDGTVKALAARARERVADGVVRRQATVEAQALVFRLARTLVGA